MIGGVAINDVIEILEFFEHRSPLPSLFIQYLPPHLFCPAPFHKFCMVCHKSQPPSPSPQPGTSSMNDPLWKINCTISFKILFHLDLLFYLEL